MVRLARVVNVLVALPAALAASPQIPLSSSPDDRWTFTMLSNSTFHEHYHPLSETNDFLYALALLYPDNISVESIGPSGEGRQILAATITRSQIKKKSQLKLKKKPRFVLMGAQHAREWIATSTALYLAQALLAGPDEPGSITNLLNLFDFYIIPTPNPDGYEYTWQEDRFWYKNRTPVPGTPECRGIDMNRNWGFGWKPSSTPNEGPCASWYPGEKPFQAPEVNHLANYFEQLKPIMAFIDLRSYGQMISTPYSYSCDVVPPDEEDILEAALGAAAALRKIHGTQMKAGMLCETLYRAPGNVLDWMYETNGVKYSYAVHLRDTGTYGYVLPETWIKPTGEETAGLVSYLADFISKERKRNKMRD